MITNQVPYYMSSLIPQPYSHRFNLRNASRLPTILCRTEFSSTSVILFTIRQWNTIPPALTTLHSTESFKNALNSSTFQPNKLFKVSNRKSQNLHTSSLNDALFGRSLVESPMWRFFISSYSILFAYRWRISHFYTKPNSIFSCS